MATYFNVDPTTVCRLESRTDGEEPGALRRLLDLLEADPSLMPAEPASQPATS